MSKWDNVRNRRDERVKRNRAVVYFGQPMRIANTDGDGVLPRKHKLSDYFLAITLAQLNTIVRILGYTPADESETP
jgi:hypothetical protein